MKWPNGFLFSLALLLLSGPLFHYAQETRLGRLLAACWLALRHKSIPLDRRTPERTAQLD